MRCCATRWQSAFPIFTAAGRTDPGPLWSRGPFLPHGLAQGLRRVAIVDWDVHHGNGTQEMFYDDPRVLYVSLHQSPFYPGTGDANETGAGEGRGFTVNIPLSEGAGEAVYAAAFDRVVLPILDDYSPELVLVSAGFDAHERDPLGGMRLGASAYGWMTRALGGKPEVS